MHHSTDLFFFGRNGTFSQVAAGAKRLKQHGGDAFELCRFCRLERFSFGGSAGLPVLTGELVKTDRDRLPKIHRRMLFTRRDVQEPVAMAEIVIRQPALFRTEQESHTAYTTEPL